MNVSICRKCRQQIDTGDQHTCPTPSHSLPDAQDVTRPVVVSEQPEKMRRLPNVVLTKQECFWMERSGTCDCGHLSVFHAYTPYSRTGTFCMIPGCDCDKDQS